MTTQEAEKEFDGQLTALELVLIYLDRAISLLHRSLEGKVPLSDRDNTFVRIVLTHYIVNNIAALFDDKDKKVNSLVNIAKRFEGNFPHEFFTEYRTSIEEFRMKHKADLARIAKNRNLMTAHLGASKKERLGWSPPIAKKMDKILGTKSTVAQDDSLRFITPFQIFDMPIMKDVPELQKAIENLRFKVLEKNL